jgi:hypothetical protein
MSSGVLHRLTEKKGKQLSKFLGIDSVPSTQLIATMQSRINNPLFKLSMTDYEAMCGNKMMVKMMSKVIGCEEKQLKKFCKYINVFAENIESSPKSIKNKMKATNSINASKRKGSLSVLPDDILEKIVNKYKTIFKIKYKLKDWIPPEKLDWRALSANPNAIEMLKANPNKIDKMEFSRNTNDEAIELLIANPNKIDWRILSANPNPEAIELLKKNFDNINWGELSRNPNPNAIELLKANRGNINYYNLSKNPNAIELLKENPDKIIWSNLSTNPNAIELLKENLGKIDWKWLSSNPNDEAIELLNSNRNRNNKINWAFLSANPNPEAIKLLKKYPKRIEWWILSSNPNPEAIELLKKNKDNIDWKNLSSNPAIFDEILE